MKREQRLHTLEDDIRQKAESIRQNGLEIGRLLIEIRDNELWRDNFDSWNQYLKVMAEELVGKSFTHSAKLIQAAEVSQKLSDNGLAGETTLTAKHLTELARLAPTAAKPDGGAGTAKDYSSLRKQDVARVLKRAVEFAESETPSVRDIRQAVDEDLGIDRVAEAKRRKELFDADRLEIREPMLSVYVSQIISRIESATEDLEKIEPHAWESLKKPHADLSKQPADKDAYGNGVFDSGTYAFLIKKLADAVKKLSDAATVATSDSEPIRKTGVVKTAAKLIGAAEDA